MDVYPSIDDLQITYFAKKMDAKPTRKFKDYQACLSALYPTCESKWKEDVEKAKTEPGASMRKAVMEAFKADGAEHAAKYNAWLERHPEEKQKIQAMRDRKKGASAATTTTTTPSTSPAAKRAKSGIDAEPEIAKVVSDLSKHGEARKENNASVEAEIEGLRKDLKRTQERFDEDTKRLRKGLDEDTAKLSARVDAVEKRVRYSEATRKDIESTVHKIDVALSSLQA
jgi:hypothetical protein